MAIKKETEKKPAWKSSRKLESGNKSTAMPGKDRKDIEKTIDSLREEASKIKKPEKSERDDPNYISPFKLFEYRKKGLTLMEVSKVTGINYNTLRVKYAKAYEDVDNLEEFKNLRADLFAYYQRLILSTITISELEKASLGQRLTVLGILFDKEKIERNGGGLSMDLLSLAINKVEVYLSKNQFNVNTGKVAPVAEKLSSDQVIDVIPEDKPALLSSDSKSSLVAD